MSDYGQIMVHSTLCRIDCSQFFFISIQCTLSLCVLFSFVEYHCIVWFVGHFFFRFSRLRFYIISKFKRFCVRIFIFSFHSLWSTFNLMYFMHWTTCFYEQIDTPIYDYFFFRFFSLFSHLDFRKSYTQSYFIWIK